MIYLPKRGFFLRTKAVTFNENVITRGLRQQVIFNKRLIFHRNPEAVGLPGNVQSPATPATTRRTRTATVTGEPTRKLQIHEELQNAGASPTVPPAARPPRARSTEVDMLRRDLVNAGPKWHAPGGPAHPREQPGDVADHMRAHWDDELTAMCHALRSHAPAESESDSPKPTAALRGPDAAAWFAALEAKIRQLLARGTYVLVPRASVPSGKTVLRCHYVLKKKFVDPGDGMRAFGKFKARLTAGGNFQMPGQDFDATWAPVIKLETLRVLVAYAVTHGYDITQLDFDGAYLNGEVDTDLYMHQPPGHEQVGPNGEAMVCKLKKSLYGLKQAGRIWYKTLTAHLLAEGFHMNKADTCVFTK